MNRWLVRTHHNEIHGPLSENALRESILQGRWDIRDEACRENHYWFSFREAHELQEQLGLQWPAAPASILPTEERTDEITETETQTQVLQPERIENRETRPTPQTDRDERFYPRIWTHPWFWGFLAVLWFLVVGLLKSLK